MSQPKISITLTTYNRAEWVREAVESILKQDYGSFELLVGDNASTDGTEAYFRSVTDPRLRYFRHEKNIGGIANGKFLFDKCQGEYIAIFHDDDEMLPGSLQARAAFLDANPSVGMVHTNVFVRTSTSCKLYWGEIRRDYIPETEVIQSEDFLRRLTLWRLRGKLYGVNMPSVMLRRTVFDKAGGFDPAVSHLNDKEMWMRISLFYDIGYLSCPTVNYREHDTQHSKELKGNKSEEQEYLALRQLYLKYRTSHPQLETIWQEFRQAFKHALTESISTYAKKGNLSLVTGFVWLLFQVSPLSIFHPNIISNAIESLWETLKVRISRLTT